MKEFAVVGLGNFGYNIAKKLSEKGNRVLAIDIDSIKVNEIKDFVNDAVIGDAKNKTFLQEFIDEKIDGVIISIGSNIIDSILAVHHLKALKVKNIIVKAQNDVHAELLKVIGVTEIISPEKDIAEWVAHKLTDPNLIDYIPLTSEFSIVEVACPDNFSGKTLKELKLRTRFNVLVIAVKDILNDSFTLLPESNYKFRPDTILTLLGKKSSLDKFKIDI
ncbi:MAG: TrkA family potassium uptake protein [Ignavibacteriaceae bacterium]